MYASRRSSVSRREEAASQVNRKSFRNDEENQVTPFHLDDGTDDNEEIRRRRYSSSSSSSSSGFERQRNARYSRGRVQKKFSVKHSHRESDENEWEKASSASSGKRHDSYSDNSSDSEDEPAPPKQQQTRTATPDSPRKPNRQKTQQSDDDEEDEDSDVEEPATPNIVIAPVRSVDLSNLGALSKLAVYPGSEAQLLQGHIVRVKTLLHSQYHFFINNQLILMAEKQLKARTSNYYVFDMTRAAGGLSTKLTKKSGNYIGKLRSNFSKKKNVLIGNQSRKTELGAIVFNGNVNNSEPRRLVVVLPPLNPKRQELEGVAIGGDDAFSMLIQRYKVLKHSRADSPHTHRLYHELQVFENKQPVFENGFYRLNFNGRVSMPSVKNFQLVKSNVNSSSIQSSSPPASAASSRTTTPREDDPEVFLQFGKVDDKKFHLDFRAPITPIQAFAVALAQFNV
ncbi:hypothetical protein Poli38472_012088 [Pythium oligandrum]|uniref:Tubby C-terminal domain-containing protein n=1 Tax=Pythium oligandrum TaxID=41045 RepID=A0A8K1CQU2_PYTOL|nr:hypothetical protein Poli38472_012088 [Pythium oligandrum]|eukprot:TMW66972.1 hypothetical protein Poli38472_012088 [Pythium oligandrum]